MISPARTCCLVEILVCFAWYDQGPVKCNYQYPHKTGQLGSVAFTEQDLHTPSTTQQLIAAYLALRSLNPKIP